jgi:hypothetical protein
MNFFEHILNFITDRSKRLSTRATVIILTLFCILLIDNIFGVSFYYNKQRQLNQLQSVSLLLKDSTLSKETHLELVSLERQALNRKSIIDYSLSLFQNMSWTSSKQSQNTTNNNANPIRNNFWFLISASGIYILTAIFVVPVLLITDKKTPFLKLIAAMVMFVFIMFFSSWFNYWLFDKLIPDRLWGSWIWNYIANFIAQLGLIIGVYMMMATIDEKTNVSP